MDVDGSQAEANEIHAGRTLAAGVATICSRGQRGGLGGSGMRTTAAAIAWGMHRGGMDISEIDEEPVTAQLVNLRRLRPVAVRQRVTLMASYAAAVNEIVIIFARC